MSVVNSVFCLQSVTGESPPTGLDLRGPFVHSAIKILRSSSEMNTTIFL